MESHIKYIIEILDTQRDELHKAAADRFYISKNIEQSPNPEKDTKFCELCIKANYIAILRRKIYTGEIEI